MLGIYSIIMTYFPDCCSPMAEYVGCVQGIWEQHSYSHWADTTRNRCNRGGLSSDGFKLYIPNQHITSLFFRSIHSIDPDVNCNNSLGYHISFYEIGYAYRCYDNVGWTAYIRQISSAAVANCNRCIPSFPFKGCLLYTSQSPREE